MKTVDTIVNAGSAEETSLSISSLFVLWGGLFLLIQQVERFFLLPTTLSLESPTPAVILKTLAAGVAQDVVAAAGVLATGTVLALSVTLAGFLVARIDPRAASYVRFTNCLKASFGLILLILTVITMVDMSYYHFSHQRLNFVFFEYVADFLGAPVDGVKRSQAAQQTNAELEHIGQWGMRACRLLVLEGLTLFVWWRTFHRLMSQTTVRWTRSKAFVLNTISAVAFAIAAMGASSHNVLIKPWIESDTYFMLAQNPILFSKDSARAAIFHQWNWTPDVPDDSLSVSEAVGFYQRSRGQGGVFPYPRYPFVERMPNHEVEQFRDPPNVLVIFVEGLDRRYVGRTVEADRPIQVTPFLDSLKQSSLYFEHFFSNGVQTSRGLFATLCSYYPRQGAAAIKTRSTQEYLCLPSLLHERGYRTEMVVGQQGAINNLRNFFTKNGIERLYDIEDFSPYAEQMGLGMTDAAIFDFITARLKVARSSNHPLFLTALTLSMHHPFIFPKVHEDVKALEGTEDRYLPALRYFDSEFERFFSGLQYEGLLKNTIVFVLGDHGRHEPQGTTDVEKQVGHFMTPLFIWLDDSLRTDEAYRPRVVDTIASQVDVAPTILALSRSEPTISPFVGRDLSCLLGGDCLHDNTAYLTSVYDDLIGLVGEKGIWLYSFRKERLDWTDLTMHATERNPDALAEASSVSRQLFSLYLASNVLLEQDRIWSWQEFKEALYGQETPHLSANPALRHDSERMR